MEILPLLKCQALYSPYLEWVYGVCGGWDGEDRVGDVDQDEEGGDDEGNAAGHRLGRDHEANPAEMRKI